MVARENKVIDIESEILTIEEVQTLLNIGKNTAYDLVKKAYKEKMPFPVIKIGRVYRVPREKFMIWLRNGSE